MLQLFAAGVAVGVTVAPDVPPVHTPLLFGVPVTPLSDKTVPEPPSSSTNPVAPVPVWVAVSPGVNGPLHVPLFTATLLLNNLALFAQVVPSLFPAEDVEK